jgi:hypothetical protein
MTTVAEGVISKRSVRMRQGAPHVLHFPRAQTKIYVPEPRAIWDIIFSEYIFRSMPCSLARRGRHEPSALRTPHLCELEFH